MSTAYAGMALTNSAGASCASIWQAVEEIRGDKPHLHSGDSAIIVKELSESPVSHIYRQVANEDGARILLTRSSGCFPIWTSAISAPR